MRVLMVNTSDNTGGAALACYRLMNALESAGVEVRMLVRDKGTHDSRVTSIGNKWKKAVERLMLLPFTAFNWKRSWTIDTNWLGTDITATEAFQWADVIHLHWVNQGFLSVEDIGKIARSGKKVVWTLHDLWPLDSIYHYSQQEKYPCLESGTLKRKLKACCGRGISFVACSKWLEGQLASSPLLKGNTLCSIPNPIDTSLFCPKDKTAARRRLGLPSEEKIVLFVSQKLSDERKGARYFIEAVNAMDNISVAVLGADGELVAEQIRHNTHVLGYVSDQQKIVDIYNSADVFVLPSLNDNLPNTIMEAMACGVPCVGFATGGIPQMIDHGTNGFIAGVRNTDELRQGIASCLENQASFSQACITKVKNCFSQKAVAEKFIELYGRTDA